jgi:hypothetical protein
VLAVGCGSSSPPPPRTAPPSVASSPPARVSTFALSPDELAAARDACDGPAHASTRLALPTGPSSLTIDFTAAMKPGFSYTPFVECAAFSVDGSPWMSVLFEDHDEGAKARVLAEMVREGEHTLRVVVAIRFRTFCIYCYSTAVRMFVSRARSFVTRKDAPLAVGIELYEAGGPTTPIEERPRLRIRENGIEMP